MSETFVIVARKYFPTMNGAQAVFVHRKGDDWYWSDKRSDAHEFDSRKEARELSLMFAPPDPYLDVRVEPSERPCS